MFQSPCGEVIVKVVKLWEYEIVQYYHVSVPLRGSDRESSSRK